MSRLEQFIREHRDEFDNEVPASQVWTKMEQELLPVPPGRKGRILPVRILPVRILRWSVAAAILVLAGFGVFHLLNKPASAPPTANQPNNSQEEELLGAINPVYAKEVYHFTQLIELKQGELKQIEKDDPELYRSFVDDINKLDSSYNSLKKELPTNPNREQLLEAMIQNLKLQTDLLNQQLQIIQQIKQTKQRTNVKTI